MGKRGRLYSPEFKAEAVRLVQASDERRPVPKIAKGLDVFTETLRKWVNRSSLKENVHIFWLSTRICLYTALAQNAVNRLLKRSKSAFHRNGRQVLKGANHRCGSAR